MGTLAECPEPLAQLGQLLSGLGDSPAEKQLANDALVILQNVAQEVQAARAAIGNADGIAAATVTNPAHVQMGLADKRGSDQLPTTGQYSGNPASGKNQSGGANESIR